MIRYTSEILLDCHMFDNIPHSRLDYDIITLDRNPEIASKSMTYFFEWNSILDHTKRSEISHLQYDSFEYNWR